MPDLFSRVTTDNRRGLTMRVEVFFLESRVAEIMAYNLVSMGTLLPTTKPKIREQLRTFVSYYGECQQEMPWESYGPDEREHFDQACEDAEEILEGLE